MGWRSGFETLLSIDIQPPKIHKNYKNIENPNIVDTINEDLDISINFSDKPKNLNSSAELFNEIYLSDIYESNDIYESDSESVINQNNNKSGSVQLLGQGSGFEPLLSIDIHPSKIQKNNQNQNHKNKCTDNVETSKNLNDILNDFLIHDITDHELNISATNSNQLNESDIYLSDSSFIYSFSKYNDISGGTDIMQNITDVKDIIFYKDHCNSSDVTLTNEDSNKNYAHKLMLRNCKYCDRQLVHICTEDPIVIDIEDQQTYTNVPVIDNEDNKNSQAHSSILNPEIFPINDLPLLQKDNSIIPKSLPIFKHITFTKNPIDVEIKTKSSKKLSSIITISYKYFRSVNNSFKNSIKNPSKNTKEI